MSRALPDVSDEQRRMRLAHRQLLLPERRVDTVEEVADAVCGLHATDAATVFLSAFARLARPSAAEVERALYEDVSLVKLLSMRRTLFAVTRDFAPYVGSSTARAVAARERATLLKHLRENAEGWDEPRLLRTEAVVLAALAERGQATASQLAADVPALRETILMAAGKPYEARQSVGSRLLRLLAADGHIRRARPRGTWTSSNYPWAPAASLPEVPERDARAEVVRRWLGAFGPGTVEDVKWWTGWALRDTRAALADAGAAEVRLEGGVRALVARDDELLSGAGESEGPGAWGRAGSAARGPDAAGPDAAEPWAALLPGLDPTVMGWRDRDWYLAPGHRVALFDRAGNAGPTVWWRGRIVGGWAQRADGEVVWRALTDVGREARAAVEAEAAGLTGRLGEVRVTPRFRTPLERELTS